MGKFDKKRCSYAVDYLLFTALASVLISPPVLAGVPAIDVLSSNLQSQVWPENSTPSTSEYKMTGGIPFELNTSATRDLTGNASGRYTGTQNSGDESVRFELSGNAFAQPELYSFAGNFGANKSESTIQINQPTYFNIQGNYAGPNFLEKAKGYLTASFQRNDVSPPIFTGFTTYGATSNTISEYGILMPGRYAYNSAMFASGSPYGSIPRSSASISGSIGLTLTPKDKVCKTPDLEVLAHIAQNSYVGDVGYDDFHHLRNGPSINAGFSAEASINSSKCQIVIAFRGTVADVSAPLSSLKSIATDATFADNVPNEFFLQSLTAAERFIYDLHQEFPDATITLTGHSLGGAIAQLMGKASGLRTQAFNSPGAGDIVMPITADLQRIKGLGPQTENVNNRIYGDIVSQVGTPIGPQVTRGLSRFGGLLLANTGNLAYVHKITSIVDQIHYPIISLDDMADEPNYVRTVRGAAKVISSGSGDLRLVIPVIKSVLTYLDPEPSSHYTLLASDTSPLINALQLPVLDGVDGYLVRHLNGNDWSAFEKIGPGAEISFAASSAIEFSPLDGLGQNILADVSLFAVRFESTGDFLGLLRVDSVPEPAWIAAMAFVPLRLIARRRRVYLNDLSRSAA